MTIPKILIVDDEPDIVDLLTYNLEKAGYEIQSANDGYEAIEKLKSFAPQLIVLDVMMPKLDGIQTAKEIRRKREFDSVFLLFLTASSDEATEVGAFAAGADDFLSKPIKPQALLSRIQTIFKRILPNDTPQNIEIQQGNLYINKANRKVILGQSEINLPKKEFDLLFFFMSNPNLIFNRDQLLNEIWGSDIFVVERTVDVHIRKLREKIGETFIKTYKGVGYQFINDTL